MPQIAPIQIAGILKRYMTTESLTQGDVSELLGLSRMTIAKFISGKTSPHRETIEKIEHFLKDEGAMTRFGFPTDVPPPIGSAVPTPDDTEQLADMGIVTPAKPKHYLCAYLGDFDFALLVQAIMNLSVDEQTKTRLLGTLCAQDFPSLA